MEEVRDRVREMMRCSVCVRIPARPVFFPACGHSPMCEACARLTKPKKCPLCDEPNKTPSTRLKVNKALDCVFRDLFAEEYSDRPHTDDLAAEIERRKAVDDLKALSALYEAELAEGTSTRLACGAGTFCTGGAGKSTLLNKRGCGPVMVPGFSHKRVRFFFGCPRWRPSVGSKRPAPAALQLWQQGRMRVVLGRGKGATKTTKQIQEQL